MTLFYNSMGLCGNLSVSFMFHNFQVEIMWLTRVTSMQRLKWSLPVTNPTGTNCMYSCATSKTEIMNCTTWLTWKSDVCTTQSGRSIGNCLILIIIRTIYGLPFNWKIEHYVKVFIISQIYYKRTWIAHLFYQCMFFTCKGRCENERTPFG